MPFILNDSKNVLGSHKDRHECLGAGNLTMDAIVRIINHPALKNCHFTFETPNDLEGYAREIAMLKAAKKKISLKVKFFSEKRTIYQV